MPKGKANFRESDLKRAMRAAASIGQAVIEIAPDGTIRIIPPEMYYPDRPQAEKQEPEPESLV